jgi:hypothetical protein
MKRKSEIFQQGFKHDDQKEKEGINDNDEKNEII